MWRWRGAGRGEGSGVLIEVGERLAEGDVMLEEEEGEEIEEK